MAAVARGWKKPGCDGPSVRVAKEFYRADSKKIVRGYARGGLSKLADLMKETAEQTSKRQVREAKAAKAGVAGVFSTLDEMIRNSPKAKMTSQEWSDYLQPGAPHVRGDVTFRLKPEELEHSGVGQYLSSLGSDQLPLKIPRADLRDLARSTRDKVDFYYRSDTNSGSAYRPQHLGSDMNRSPNVSVSGLPEDVKRYEPSVRHAREGIANVQNPISYSAMVPSALGGDLITRIGSAAHEPALDHIATPKPAMLDELSASIAGTPLESEFTDLADALGLKKSAIGANDALHPALEATTRGYGKPYMEAYDDWGKANGYEHPRDVFYGNRRSFEQDTGRDLGGNFEPANINVPFKGVAGYAGLELRKRLLNAAREDRSFLGLARPEDLPERGSDAFANSTLGDPTGIPKQLRKLASQYGLSVDPNYPVAMPDKQISARDRQFPEKYIGLVCQRANDLFPNETYVSGSLDRAREHMQDNPPTFDDYYNHAKNYQATRTEEEPQNVRSFTRDFKRNVLLAAKENKDHLTTLFENNQIPEDMNDAAHAALNAHDPMLKRMIDDYSNHPYYDPDPVDYDNLRLKAGNVDSIIAEHYKRQRALPEPVQEPYRRMAAILSPEDRERIKKIGVPLWALGAATIGQQAIDQPPDSAPESNQGFAHGGIVRGYARGGLRKLSDLLKETTEQTLARRAEEMKAANTTIPGAFSTLNELVENAPMGKALPMDWSNYLAPGKTLMRGDVAFPLKKEELDFSGIRQYLANAAERLKADPSIPQHITREDLASWLQANRPGINHVPLGGGASKDPQYSGYASKWPQESGRNGTYREDVLTLTDPDLARAAREVTPHFSHIPGSFMWTRGYDLPGGGFLNELQHDPGGKAADRFATYDTSIYDKLRALVGRTPNAARDGVDATLANIESRYIPNKPEELKAGEKASQGAIIKRRNDVPGVSHVDERIPFLDLQTGHAPIGIRQMLVRLADANKRFLAIGNRDDAGYAAGAGGYSGLASGRQKAMTNVYEHSYSAGEGADESRTKGMIFTPLEKIQKQYGLGFDPNHLISGGEAKAGLPLPSSYGQTGDVRFGTHIRHLLESHPPGLNPETEHALTITTVQDAAQKALDHYNAVDWPDEHSYEAAIHLSQAEDVMTEVLKHLSERPNTPLNNDYYLTLISNIQSLDKLSNASGSPEIPAIHRPALTMTPEQAQKVSKIGFPLWSLLGAGAATGLSAPQDSEAAEPGYAQGGAVRPGYLSRMGTAMKPLWMARDDKDQVKPLSDYLSIAGQLKNGAPKELGITDSVLGTPADFGNLLHLLARKVMGHSLDHYAAPKDELGIQSAIDWLRNKSQGFSDRGNALRSDVMARDQIPEAQDWKERLADTGGEMLGSVPLPGKIGPAARGLGVMEYIIPTIHPAPLNYLHGTVGGSILKEGLPRMLGADDPQLASAGP